MRSFKFLGTLSVALALTTVLMAGASRPLCAQEAQRAFTLEDLLGLGRERNPHLLSLRSRVQSAVAGRRDAGRIQNPEVEYGFGNGEPFDASETKSLRELSIRQVVENPLARHFRLASLDEGVAAEEERARQGGLEVEYEIRLHFYRILFLQELVELRRLNEEALNEVRELIELRARAGEVRELEAIRLKVEHLRARNDLAAAELELDQFRRHLDMFLGEALPDDYELVGTLEGDLRVPDFETLDGEILPGHPLLQQAALSRSAAEKEWKASQYAWLPNPVISASSAKELDGDVVRFGVGVEIPLWNQSRAAARRERETLAAMEHEEESLRLDLQAQLMIHHNQLLLHRRSLELFREGLLEEAEVSMGIAETSYREGEISLVEYLDARRAFQSIQMEYQQALYDWNREMTELDRAVGGGVL
jgi:cobalt-zinc-cadmium efflux system outer membrane protein